MSFIRPLPSKSHGLLRLSTGRWSKTPTRNFIQGTDRTAGSAFQSPQIRMTPRMIRVARFTKKIGWKEEPPIHITPNEYHAMMTTSRIKVNIIGVAFMICLSLSIIRKGKELQQRGRSLHNCSEDEVDLLRLQYLLGLREERDKAKVVAGTSKS
ncbi:uncharacterized protein LOC125674709 [Ostrea edulis]|uniref:uncharacterized protein LOC125674709 n=1 Tax=Ostrea edulis TaxID=37623 RepID=UPI002095B0A0|nr:uncharacterized protein LOC125674709 [Ostrea edulis]